MHDIDNFHGKKITSKYGFSHFSGTAVLMLIRASHLFITSKIDFVLVFFTQVYSIPIKIAKKNYKIQPQVKIGREAITY
jgi:hypothetical protein